MLSRKQMWRKQAGLVRLQHYNSFWQSILTGNVTSIWDILTLRDNDIPEIEDIDSNAKETSSMDEDSSKLSEKRVHFAVTSFVTLVPERSEYIKAGLASSIWWSQTDQSDFASDAKKEVTDFMQDHSVDSKDATRLLYQPGEYHKPIGSPNSVVPNYDEYLMLIESYAATMVNRDTGEGINADLSAKGVAYHFTSIAAAEVVGPSVGFIPVKGRSRSCSTTEGLGVLGTDDSWTVLKQAPGCAGIL